MWLHYFKKVYKGEDAPTTARLKGLVDKPEGIPIKA